MSRRNLVSQKKPDKNNNPSSDLKPKLTPEPLTPQQVYAIYKQKIFSDLALIFIQETKITKTQEKRIDNLLFELVTAVKKQCSFPTQVGYQEIITNFLNYLGIDADQKEIEASSLCLIFFYQKQCQQKG